MVQDATGDNAPPAWTGSGGVTAVTGTGPLHISFDTATDASAPVNIALYVQPTAFGTDWRFPVGFLDQATLAGGYDYDGYYDGVPTSFTARALDGAGSRTTNINTFEFTPNPGQSPLLDTIGPGDELVLTWADPAHDLDLDILAPNFNESSGDPGRSFVVGQNSTVTGLAEERIRLSAHPPDGGYLVIVQWHSMGSGNETTLKSYQANGGLKHNLAK